MIAEVVTSATHSFIKDERVVEARELTSAAGRACFHKVQLEGEESIQWALEARLSVEHFFYSANLRQCAFLKALRARGIPLGISQIPKKAPQR